MTCTRKYFETYPIYLKASHKRSDDGDWCWNYKSYDQYPQNVTDAFVLCMPIRCTSNGIHSIDTYFHIFHHPIIYKLYFIHINLFLPEARKLWHITSPSKNWWQRENKGIKPYCGNNFSARREWRNFSIKATDRDKASHPRNWKCTQC